MQDEATRRSGVLGLTFLCWQAPKQRTEVEIDAVGPLSVAGARLATVSASPLQQMSRSYRSCLQCTYKSSVSCSVEPGKRVYKQHSVHIKPKTFLHSVTHLFVCVDFGLLITVAAAQAANERLPFFN